MLQTWPTYTQKGRSERLPLLSTPCQSLGLNWWLHLNFWTQWRRSLILCDICKDSTSLSFPNSPVSSSFYTEITALCHALGWCLQHHSTCPIISLAVFTNSQSSLSLLNSASNLFAPIAVRTIWPFIAAYLISPNCPSIGSLATTICPNEIADLLVKTFDGIPSPSLPLGLLVSTYL